MLPHVRICVLLDFRGLFFCFFGTRTFSVWVSFLSARLNSACTLVWQYACVPSNYFSTVTQSTVAKGHLTVLCDKKNGMFVALILSQRDIKSCFLVCFFFGSGATRTSRLFPRLPRWVSRSAVSAGGVPPSFQRAQTGSSLSLSSSTTSAITTSIPHKRSSIGHYHSQLDIRIILKINRLEGKK